MKRKILLCALSFIAVALFSCGIAFLPNWNPKPSTPPSDIGQEEVTDARTINYSGRISLHELISGFATPYDDLYRDAVEREHENYNYYVRHNVMGMDVSLTANFGTSSPYNWASFTLNTPGTYSVSSSVKNNSWTLNDSKCQVSWTINSEYYNAVVTVNGSDISNGGVYDSNSGLGDTTMDIEMVIAPLGAGYAIWDGYTNQKLYDSDNSTGIGFYYYLELLDVTEYIKEYTGYHFAGWCRGRPSDLGENITDGDWNHDYLVVDDLYQEFTATYKPNTYSVKFYRNHSSSDTTTSTQSGFTYDQSKALKTNSWTKTGYTFKGWSTSRTATTATYTDKQSVKNLTSTNDGTVNLYAVWAINSYKLTVNPNGGTWSGSTSSQSFTQNYNTTRTIANPKRTGYTFTGWSLSGAGSLSGTTYTYGAGAGTLTAQWKINSYKLTVNPNGGTWSGSTSSQSFTQNYNTTKTIANPTRTGYTFTGWTLSGVGSLSGTTYTYGAGAGTLTAQWKINSYTLSVDLNGGTLNGSTSTTTQTVSYRDMINLATPTRTGYTFKGWRVTSGDATVTETQYLWEEQSFDGVDDYIAIGRDQMYTDKITVAIIAYMDNWSLYGSRNMRLISCTEGGGWNFESNNGYIQVSVYDSGVGYKHITLTKQWSSLSSGWHSFTLSFDGHNARLFIDGVMEGKSADFSSGEIGYNSTNGIFIGAEAYSSTTTPASTNLFEGIIESVIIVNDYVYGADFSQAGSFVIVHEDTTIRAIWEDTWARHYTMPEGSGTEEDPYQVSTATELAYFAYKTQIQGQESYDYIVLTDDIDLAGYDWLPMGRARGTNTGFRGTFDGQGHTISNLNVNVSGIAKNTEYGLFGLVDSGAVIKNFSIVSGQVNGFDNNTGAVAGYIWSATIENVTNYVDVVGATNVGGIVGQLTRSTTISNAINNGNISGTHRVGGIVGGTEAVVATRSLLGVANTGTVTAYDCTGGIIGYGYSISISGAYNSYTATVEGDIGAYTGGIAGYLFQNCIVEGTVNTADVIGERCVGGIVGAVSEDGSSYSVTTSYAEGNIEYRGSSLTQFGTLVGSASANLIISDCFFNGTSNAGIGTYYGSAYTPASISNCYAIINGTKNITAGTFANWVILEGMNDGNPIQKDLIFEGMTDQLPNTADLIKDWIASA